MGHLFICILKSIITLAAAKDFFRYYEKLNFVSHQEFLRVRHNIWQKQNPLHSTDKLTTAWIRMQGQKSIQVFLKAFETEWNIFARYDEDFCNDDAVVETHSPTGNIITRNFQDLGIVAFKGIVRTSLSTPKFVGTVKGSVQGGIFQGHIALYNDSLYIEPAKKFCIENCWYNAIIYRASDVMFSNFLVRRCQGHDEIGCVQDYMENEVHEWKEELGFSNNYYNNGIDIEQKGGHSNPNRPRTCMLLSIADDLFAKSYGGTNGAVQKMKEYLETADHIFRKTDFNGDYISDNVGVKAKKYMVYEKPDHPMAEYDNSRQIIRALGTLQPKDYCLAIMFSRKRWTPLGVIGLAFVGVSNPHPPTAGICAGGKSFLLESAGKMMTYNVLIVTEMDSTNYPLPDLINAMTTTHELGHSFGSSHDSTKVYACFPGAYTPVGNYIMSPVADDGQRENNKLFSKCSIERINPVIQNNGDCMDEGIPGEAPEQPPPEPDGPIPSPHPRPPRPTHPPKKRPLLRSECRRKQLQPPCVCHDDDSCELCCKLKSNGSCVKSSALGILDDQNKIVKAPMGTPCKDKKLCNMKGNCVATLGASFSREEKAEEGEAPGAKGSETLKGDKRWIVENWIYLTMGILTILVVVGTVIGQSQYNKRKQTAKAFSKSLSKAASKVNKHLPEKKIGKKKSTNRNTIARLKVLFPKAPLSLLQKTAEQHKNEKDAVRYLVKQGHSIKKI